MIYTALTIVAFLLCLLVAYSGLKILFHNSWILGWLRGMFGLALLVLAGMFALVALDVFSYRQIDREQVVATLSFEKKAEQVFAVTLVDAEGEQSTYELRGDQWQLDARIIKWRGVLASVGIAPGYRLDRISGRYFALDKERTEPRSVFAFSESRYGVDLWQWARSSDGALGLVDASYGSATYLPMADGALFEVSLTQSGLITRPLNDAAKGVVGQWQ
ncbi:MAG TPA: cation/multidrug efflux pump [Cellvibrionaceae bacterium]